MLSLEIHRNARAPSLIKNLGDEEGNKDHKSKARIRLAMGASRKGRGLDVKGRACSLAKSLMASAKG